MPSLYQALPSPKSIRLLVFHAEDAGSAILKSNLKVYELGDAPEYEALSYAWGDGNPQVQILCNGEPFSISANLHGALRRLQPPPIADPEHFPEATGLDSNKSVRFLWVDALCINQLDLEERSQQVKVMRRIYAGASKVMVWLGEDEGHAAVGIQMINKISKLDHSAKVVDLYSPDYPGWESLQWIYDRPWFTRIWILQEIQASRKAEMMIGDWRVDWHDLSASSNRLDSTDELVGHCIWCTGPMMACWLFQATDPRDRIYALLNLSDEGSTLDQYPLIQPDYAKTVVEAYTDVTYHFLTQPVKSSISSGEKYLFGSFRECGIGRQILPRGGNEIPLPEREPNLPSWAPGWDASFLDLNFSGGSLMSSQSWRASSFARADICAKNIPGELVLRGVKLGVVRKVAGHQENSALRGSISTINKQLDMAYETLPVYKDTDGVKSAFAATVTSARRNMNLNRAEKHQPYNKEDLESYLAKGYNQEIKMDYADFASTYHLCIEYNTFFIMEDGYMGLGPAKTMVGDAIYVFLGGKVLYVVRKIEDRMKFVGECYVHGFMNGEAMDLVESGKLKKEWVCLT